MPGNTPTAAMPGAGPAFAWLAQLTSRGPRRLRKDESAVDTRVDAVYVDGMD